MISTTWLVDLLFCGSVGRSGCNLLRRSLLHLPLQRVFSVLTALGRFGYQAGYPQYQQQPDIRLLPEDPQQEQEEREEELEGPFEISDSVPIEKKGPARPGLPLGSLISLRLCLFSAPVHPTLHALHFCIRACLPTPHYN